MRFLRNSSAVTKGVKESAIPDPPLPFRRKEVGSTPNIVSLNKAEVLSVEISWSKRFLHSLCWVVCLTWGKSTSLIRIICQGKNNQTQANSAGAQLSDGFGKVTLSFLVRVRNNKELIFYHTVSLKQFSWIINVRAVRKFFPYCFIIQT